MKKQLIADTTLTKKINRLFDKAPQAMTKVQTSPNTESAARRFEKKLTPAEATLRKLLKAKQLEGRKFRRQHGVDHYILDFYCPSEKLAIELDGENHFTEEGMRYDD